MGTPVKLRRELVRSYRENYDRALLNLIFKSLEQGGFPPPRALRRARQILTRARGAFRVDTRGMLS